MGEIVSLVFMSQPVLRFSYSHSLSSPEWLERGQLNVGLVDSPAGISSPTLSATRKFNFHCGSPILFNFVV